MDGYAISRIGDDEGVDERERVVTIVVSRALIMPSGRGYGFAAGLLFATLLSLAPSLFIIPGKRNGFRSNEEKYGSATIPNCLAATRPIILKLYPLPAPQHYSPLLLYARDLRARFTRHTDRYGAGSTAVSSTIMRRYS